MVLFVSLTVKETDFEWPTLIDIGTICVLQIIMVVFAIVESLSRIYLFKVIVKKLF